MSDEFGEAIPAQDQRDEHEQTATLCDQALIQRSSASKLVSVRSLGFGSYAAVDLVSVPVGNNRKLLVRKMLLTDRSVKPVMSSTQPVIDHIPWQAGPPALKPSSQQDWSREASMHRECAECPFVLQLLAAKRCNSGNYLLLLEYATQGTLTDVIAARKLQLQRSKHMQRLQLPAPAEAAGVMKCSNTADANGGRVPVLEQQAEEAMAAAQVDDADVAAMLPLAVTAAHVVEDDEKEADEMQLDPKVPQQQCQRPYAEPVLVTLLQHTSNTAAEFLHASLEASPPTAPVVPQHDAAYATAVGNLQPVSHGLSEESAKFYAACILMGLRTLHSRRILHRDIKPCNLLLFHDGYLKLADLGCCCQLPEGITGARTRTGTAAYMAPEVVAGKAPYSYPVDMWSLGVVIWQMVAGSLPCWAQQQQGHDETVHYAPDKLTFPEHFSQDLCVLLDGLLHQDSSARLDIAAVMEAPWFQGFDWTALQQKTMEPPDVHMRV